MLYIFTMTFFNLSSVQVLVRLVGADDHLYPNSMDVMQWLADSSLLEMIVDKLNTAVSKENPSVEFYYINDYTTCSMLFGAALSVKHTVCVAGMQRKSYELPKK